jgi:D-glycero-alpha-D-manno-heptose-7-phosphate kinase
VEKDRQFAILKELKELLYVPFEFENVGTRVLYYKAEDFDISTINK